MPYIFKSNMVHVKDPETGQYLPIGVLSDQTAAEFADQFEDKLIDSYSLNSGRTVFPVVLGDVLIGKDYVPSSCIKIDNYLYIFHAPEHDSAIQSQSGLGKVTVVDLDENAIVDTQDCLCNHANSIAYDPNDEILYMVPTWDYANADLTTSPPSVSIASFIYGFSDMSDMTDPAVINTPENVMAVSYDNAIGKLYLLCFASNSEGPGIYEYSDSEFTLLGRISFDDVEIANLFGDSTGSYNQDFAVHDNCFFLSSPRGYVLYGRINAGGTTEISGSFTVARMDNCGFRRLGELEGMEFDSDGHLLAADYTYLTDDLYDAFVIEIPTVFTTPYFEPDTSYRSYRNEMVLRSSAVDSFFNTPYQLKSLNQIVNLLIKPTKVFVPENDTVIEPYVVYISGDLDLEINGTYKLPRLEITSGHLLIHPQDGSNQSSTDTHLLEFTDGSNAPITIIHGGRITFCGQNRLRIKSARVNDLLIRPGYSYAVIAWRWAPGRVVEGSDTLQSVFRIDDSTSGPIMSTNNQVYAGTLKIGGA